MTRFTAAHSIRTVVADDDPFSRSALVHLLGSAGIAVAAVVATASVAAAAERVAPDVVVLGLHDIDAAGLELVRALTAAAPASRALVLSDARDDRAVAAAMVAGAVGRLLRDAPIDDIVLGVKAAANGRPVAPATAMTALLELADLSGTPLLPNERRALTLLGGGHDERQVADALLLEPRAVRLLVLGSLRKLQLAAHLEQSVKPAERPASQRTGRGV